MENSKLGEKLRRARLEKKLTQSELAGDFITRNMLSKIENGASSPSLATIEYLASRLGIPVGYFVTDSDDGMAWRKQKELSEIRRAYSEERYDDVVRLISGIAQNGSDPELCLIAAQSRLMLGHEYYRVGKLASAFMMYRAAYETAKKTPYEKGSITREAGARMAIIYSCDKNLCDTGGLELDLTGKTNLCAITREEEYFYIRVQNLIADGRITDASAIMNTYLITDPAYRMHLTAKLFIQNNRYDIAKEALSHIQLDSDSPASVLLRYNVLTDLEQCCVKTADYEYAYRCSQKKLELYALMTT